MNKLVRLSGETSVITYVTKQSMKAKSFNTNNQKCKKKQVQTNK